MSDMVMLILKDYYHHCLFPPSINWPYYNFKKRSSERWACNEIMERIKSNKLKSPYTIIEEFADEMDYFYQKDNSENDIFEFARDQALEILNKFS